LAAKFERYNYGVTVLEPGGWHR